MLRGVTLMIPAKYGNQLADILEPIDTKQYNWYVATSECIVEHISLNEDLLPEFQLKGSELDVRVKGRPYYINFIDLKAFPVGDEVHDIETYEDFLRSKSEIVLLIADTACTTIYCKDKDTLRKVFENAKNLGFEDVEYITDENDSRTRLAVY